MRISFVKYELAPLSSNDQPRQGALLKLECNDKSFGYADCHPWLEFGDEPLQIQLRLLSEGHLTRLMQRSLHMAQKDAMLRSQNKSAFDFRSTLKNHRLVSAFYSKFVDLSFFRSIKEQGFQTLKIKVGRYPQQEIEWLNTIAAAEPFRLRLDFNSRLNEREFKDFINQLHLRTQGQIDFIEDPFSFSPSSWREINSRFKLALDKEESQVSLFELEKDAFKQDIPYSVMILKPSSQNTEPLLQFCRQKQVPWVVTSSMDHPVGQAHAAAIAFDLQKRSPELHLESGLLSHVAYAPTSYSRQLICEGSSFIGVTGTGIGFDDLLQNEPWSFLRDFSDDIQY